MIKRETAGQLQALVARLMDGHRSMFNGVQHLLVPMKDAERMAELAKGLVRQARDGTDEVKQ